MRHYSTIKIISAIVILLTIVAFQGCKGKPKKGVEVSPLKGRLVFGKPMPVGQSGNIMAPDLAMDNEGGIYISYLVGYETLHRAFFVKSTDGGEQYSGVTQLSEKEGMKPLGVTMDTLDGSIFAIWANEDEVGRKLKYRESSDYGRNFTMELSFNIAREPGHWTIAGTSAKPLIFYTDSSGDNSTLILNKGFDPVQEFTLLSPGKHIAALKAITGAKGDIYVICVLRTASSPAGQFTLLHSSDGGDNFTPYKIFTENPLPLYKNAIDFALTTGELGECLHLIWMERTANGMRLMRSRTMEKDIKSWIAPEEIVATSDVANWLCSQPLLATDGGKRAVIVYAYLKQEPEKNYIMAYRFSDDEGVTFQNEATVTEEIASPEIITGALSLAGTLHIAWDDEDHANVGQRRVFYVRGMMR